MAFSLTEYAKGNVLAVQEYSILSWRALANLFSHPRYLGDILQQMDIIGVGSLQIVVFTGFFTGAVLALQSANSLARFGALSFTGQLVSMSMVRELGPVLTSLMVAGRNASGMASELGSMQVTEQIDAMRALGTDPQPQVGNAAIGRHHVHALLSHDSLRPGGACRRVRDCACCCCALT